MFPIINPQVINTLSIHMAIPAAIALLVLVITHLSIIFQNKKFKGSEDFDSDTDLKEVSNSVVNWSLFSGILLWAYVIVGTIVIPQPSILMYCLIPFVSIAILAAIIIGRETIHRLDGDSQIRKLAFIDLLLIIVLIIISFFQRTTFSSASSSLGILITMILGGKILIDLFRYRVHDGAGRRAKTGMFLGYIFLISGLIITYLI